MMYYLDTNICVSCIRKTVEAEAIICRFIKHGYTSIRIPSIVIAELMHGAYKSKFKDQGLIETEDFIASFKIVPFDYKAAVSYGKIKASLERKGQVIGPNDMLIAATALTYNATLITNNTNEFSRIDGLKLEDWTI